MENEKKLSRFGVRLSAILVAVFLVVCMAVPAFAYGVFPDNVPVPQFAENYLVVSDTVSNRSGFYLYSFDEFDEIVVSKDTYHFYKNGASAEVYLYSTYPGLGYWSKSANTTDYRLTPSNGFEIVYSSWDVVQNGNSYTFAPPPPPDPLASVGSGLAVVIDWVGSVVSAVVSGPMSGLLILLAVPVAITLLLVAFVVIRRTIWGA